MSFIKRLFGLTDDRRGELLTSVSDQTWVSDSGEVIQQVSEDILSLIHISEPTRPY